MKELELDGLSSLLLFPVLYLGCLVMYLADH
jgi:hypothetical protein